MGKKRQIVSIENLPSGSTTVKRQITSGPGRKADLGDIAAYTVGSLGTGLLGVGEGVADLMAAGGDLLSGNAKRAESRFLDNRTAALQERLRKQYKIDRGGVGGAIGSFTGDVAQGIGQSSVFLLDAALPGLGTTLFFGGVGSQGVSSAAAETGKVGVGEFAYGALSGTVEGLTEKFIGAGGRAVKKLARGTAKTAATRAAGRSLGKTTAIEVLKSAGGEAAEEAISELADAPLRRITGVDPDATTSFGDLLYASAVGAVSGGAMAAPVTVLNQKANRRRGERVSSSGETERILNTARAVRDVAGAAAEEVKRDLADDKALRKTQKAAKKAAGASAAGAAETAADTHKAAEEASAVATDGEKKPVGLRQRREWNKYSKSAGQFATALSENLDVWESMSPEQQASPAGMALLGEISGNTRFYEINRLLGDMADEIIMRDGTAMKAMADEATRLARSQGREVTYTVDDLIHDKDGILMQMAAVEVVRVYREGKTAEEAETTQEAAEAEQGETETRPVTVKPGNARTTNPWMMSDTELDQRYGAWDEKRDEVDLFSKIATDYGVPRELHEWMKDDYVTYADGSDLRKFIPSYLAEYMRGRYHITEPGFKEYPIPEAVRKNARQLGEAYEREAVARADERARAKAGGSRSTVRESVRPAYAAEIDAWAKKGKPTGETFILGETGSVLQGLGAVENDIYLTGDKIKEILAKHPEMTLDVIKKLPQIIDDPVLVMASRNVGRTAPNSRLTMFGSVRAQDGRPVMVVLELRPVEDHLLIDDMQKVTSAYTKDEQPTAFVRRSTILYVDKKRSQRVLNAIGFYMPIAVHVSGFIGSISYKGDIVNISGKKFSEVFSESEGAQKNSDRRGAPLSESVTGPAPSQATDTAIYTADRVHYEGTVEVREGGTVLLRRLNGRGLTERQSATFTAAKIIANAMGTDIYLYASYVRDGKRYMNIDGTERPAPNGWKDAKGNLHIDLNAGMSGEGLGIFTLAHESAHLMRVYDPAGFRDIAEKVVELAEGKGVNVEAMIFRKMDELEALGRLAGMKHLEKYEYAYEEVVADAMEPILADGKALSELVDTNRTLFQKILDSIKSMIKEIKKALAGLKPESEAGRMVADMAGAMDEVRELYVVALSTAGERRRAERSRMNSEKMQDTDSRTDGEVRMSARTENTAAKFTRQLDDWMSGIMPDNGYFDIGTTPDALVSSGAKALPLVMSEEVIYKFTTDYGHEIAIDEIKKLPQELVDPVMIFKGSIDGSMVALTEMYDKSGDSVIVAIHMNRYQKRMQVNRIASIYGKHRVENYVESNLNAGNLLYASKTKAPVWFTNRGLQLPKLVQTITDATDSIPQSPPSVNPSGENNSDVRYSDRQTAPQQKPEERLATRMLASLVDRKGYTGRDRVFLDEYKAQLQKTREVRRELQEHRARLKEYRDDIQDMTAEIDRLQKSHENDARKQELIRERKELRSKRDEAQGQVKSLQNQFADADKMLREMEKSDRGEKLLRVKKVVDTANFRYKALRDREHEKYKMWRESTERRQLLKSTQSIMRRHLRLTVDPTKNQNIPIEMQPWVAMLGRAINGDTVHADERVKRLREKIAAERKRKNPNEAEIDFWERSIANIEREGRNAARYFAGAAEVYEKIKDSTDPNVYANYDKDLMDRIREAEQIVKDAGGLDRLTTEQARFVNDTAREVNHTIIEGKRARLMAMNAKAGEAAGKIEEEIAKVGERRDKRFGGGLRGDRVPTAIDFWKGAYFDELKPVYFFDFMESPTLLKLFEHLQAGEGVAIRDIEAARAFKLEMYRKHHVKDWDTETVREFQVLGGGKVKLKLHHMLSLYAYSLREQAEDHLEIGGFKFSTSETEGLKIKDKVPLPGVQTRSADQTLYRMDKAHLDQITQALTAEQRAYVDDMVEYLSTVMGAKGNEVSRQLHGIALFIERFYFPLKSDSEYLSQETRDKSEPLLKNMSMTRKTVKHANNPIILSDFDAVWSQHCVDMANYHGLAIPLEDFNRVMNYKVQPGGDEGMSSVRASITRVYGPKANAYIKRLLTDANGGIRPDNAGTPTARLISLMKKSRVMMSASVIVQQPLAAFRAMAMVAPKYFASTAAFKVGKDYTAEWELIKKYADTAVVKDIGQFDVGMGRRTADYINAREYEGLGEKGKALLKDSGYRDEAFGFLPSMADKYAWMAIWGAVENEVAEKQSNLKRGTEDFYRAVGARFDEVIRRTQVYDSLLSRSGFMRSRNALAQMATAFMAEPTVTVNMMIKAIKQVASGQRGEGARVLGATIAAMLLTAAASSLVYAMRDDDEDETYSEKYVQSLSEQVRPWVMIPNTLPYVRDVISICEGYDVERTDMTVVGDLVKAFRTLQSSQKTGYQKMEAMAGSIGTVLGLPVRNVLRDGRGIVNTIGNAGNDAPSDLGYAFKQGFLGADASDGQRLYELRLSGNKAQWDRVAARFDDEKDAIAAMRRALRDNDPRIAEAADARLAGDTKTSIRLRQEIVAEGHFADDEVMGAINSEINAIKRLEEQEA